MSKLDCNYNNSMLCYDCPRSCGVDREKNLGFCRESNKIRVAKIIENFMWEEPCLTGQKGALAIFFSGCNLRCSFCQNYKISCQSKGQTYTPKQFKDLIMSYDLSKFSCIDLITPTHFSSLLARAFKNVKLPIPIVWNSGGYEKVDIIEKISKFVDIFLVDFKYFSKKLSKEYSLCEDYFDFASKAITKMTQLKENVFENDILRQGVIIRHLILPGQTKDSIAILKYIHENIKNPIISLMSQFTPTPNSPIKRKLYPLESKLVLSYAQKLGLTTGYCQELDSSCEDFIPNFD